MSFAPAAAEVATRASTRVATRALENAMADAERISWGVCGLRMVTLWQESVESAFECFQAPKT